MLRSDPAVGVLATAPTEPLRMRTGVTQGGVLAVPWAEPPHRRVRTGFGFASSAPVIDHEHAWSIVPGPASLHRDALKCRSKASHHHRSLCFLAGHRYLRAVPPQPTPD